MAGGFSVGIAADTRPFEQGVKSGIIAPVEDAVDKLQELGDAGDRAGSDLDSGLDSANRSLSDLGDAGRDAGRDLERGLDGTGRELDKIGRAGKEAGNDLEAGMRDGQRATAKTADEIRAATRRIQADTDKLRASGKDTFEPASESSAAFKDEAKSNLSEVVSSFDGSMSSIVDLVQGTLGGVIQDLPGIGLAFGAAAAVGVGLIGAQIEKTKAQQEALREKTSELAGEYIDTGRQGVTSISYIADELRDLATETDSSKDSLTSLRKEAKAAGVDVKTYQVANAGAAQETTRALAEARKEYGRLSKAAADGSASKAERARQTALGNTIGKLLEVQRTQKDAAQAQKDYAATGADAAAAAGAAAETYSDAVQSAYQEAGASVQDYVKDGVFQLDKYQEAAQKNLDAIVGYQKNMSDAQVTLSKEGHDKAIQYLEQLGPDAAPLIDAFVKAPAAKQAELAAIWDQLGGAAATSFGTKLQRDMDATPGRKTVVVDADLSSFNTAMAEATRQREVHIKAYTDAPKGVQGMGTP